MAREDGSVSIAVNMNISKAERKLATLKEKIDKAEDNIRKMQEARNEASEKSVFQGAELDAEKAKLQEIKDRLADIKAMAKEKSLPEETRSNYATQIPAVQEQLADQETRVRMLQTEFNKTANSVDAYDQKIKSATASLSEQKSEAGALASNLANANHEQNGLGASSKAAEEAGKRIEKLGNRIKGLVSRVFIFSVITAALRAMRDMLKKTISQNKDASKAIAQLKGALLTLAQPILNVIIPAFTAFIRVLTTVINAISRIVSSLFGTTAEKSAEAAKNLYDEQNAIEGVGGAAEETKRQLSGLDEVNRFESPDSGGGGGGGSSAAIAPDFSSVVSKGISSVEELLVGEALLAIGAILTFTGVNIPLGIALMVAGAATIYDAAVLNWGSLKEELQGPLGNIVLMVGLAALAVGAILAFSGINIPLGIALMAIGAVGVGTYLAANWNSLPEKISGVIANIEGIIDGFFEWFDGQTGGKFHNTIEGLRQNFHLSFEGIRETLSGFIDFFGGIFTGDFERISLGIGKIFGGLQLRIDGTIGNIKTIWFGALDWLDKITGGKLHGIIEAAKTIIGTGLYLIQLKFHAVITAIKGIFQGITRFLSGVFTGDWEEAWEGIKDIFKGVWNGIVEYLEGAANLIIKGLNWLIEKMNGISFTVPKVIPVIGGTKVGVNIPSLSEIQIPRLAAGAVIPPNREFMAVLGDQKSGTNIEAPLSTIEEGVANVMRRFGLGQGGFNGTIRIPITIDGRTIYEAVIDQAMLRQMQTGVNPFELSY